MDLHALHFLLSPAGQALLQETAATPITPANHLAIISRLRRRVAPELAQAVVETALLRRQAAAKFSRAAAMYFTRSALEQASAEPVAAYRAARFAAAGFRTVADLGCGVGGDALALAQHGQVIGVELDLVRLSMARANVAAYGRSDRFWPLQADLRTLAPLPAPALFFDPARRDARGRRLRSMAAYRPPLALILQWQAVVAHTAVKISPAVDYAELPAHAALEFISYQGEVREGALWFGDLRFRGARRATLLPGPHTLTDTDYPGADVAVTPPKAYLYEPDGAVIRAHLVQPLARALGATQIDREIAYLTGNTAVDTPFARCFALEAALPFQLKRLRRYLRARGVGEVVIKKRGSPLEPEWLRRQLRLRGDAARTIFLTQAQGEPTVLICYGV
jgi:SAM-dependent methyltransferase